MMKGGNRAGARGDGEDDQHVDAEDTIGWVASMMKAEDCGFIPVVSEDEVVRVTDRDLRVLKG
jgi:predicted transcriptional regulator